jgi:pyridoxamine 5'-phosphate oxidase
MPPLVESKMPDDPYKLFELWYADAERAGAAQPDAVALATVSAGGQPSARMVLFKGIEGGAFLFYTNYSSRKGNDLAANPRAAIVFYWFATRHQVRVSGSVRKLSREASAEYFHSRPRGAQLSALASRQSSVVPSRAVLEQKVLQLAQRYPEEVPLPSQWGGFALRPRWIEFWENREDRLHDRIRYSRRAGGGWRLERLSP